MSGSGLIFGTGLGSPSSSGAGSVDVETLLLIGGGAAAARLVPGIGRLVGLASVAFGVMRLLDGLSGAGGLVEGLSGDLGTTSTVDPAPPEAYQVNILEPAWQESVSGPMMVVTVQLKNPSTVPIKFQPVVTVTEQETHARARAVTTLVDVGPQSVVTKQIAVNVAGLPLHGTVFGLLGGAASIVVEVQPVPNLLPGMDRDSRSAVLVS